MNNEIIIWETKYETGIAVIDTQHKQLVNLANELYGACLTKGDHVEAAFRDAMKRMVDYVRFHFDAENKLLAAINYPEATNHKKMHDTLIKNIIDASKEYSEGKKFVPNNFVRTLVDWVFSHIAFYDRQYSLFAVEKLRTGSLTHEKLKEIEKSIA
ncbi:MAG: bacteriohemerythrin [Treponema sp.]|nr:bacteriohemerythrin [Treponema sp.]